MSWWLFFLFDSTLKSERETDDANTKYTPICTISMSTNNGAIVKLSYDTVGFAFTSQFTYRLRNYCCLSCRPYKIICRK